MTVDADEFIRRFLIHALPPGFPRIRYFGFLANCHRTAKLGLCRQPLIVPIADLLPQPADCRQLLEAITEKKVNRCPHCGISRFPARSTKMPSSRQPAPVVCARIDNTTLSRPTTADFSLLTAPKPTLTTPCPPTAENTLASPNVFRTTDLLGLAIQNA